MEIEETITIRPAKRILVFYLLAFVAVMVVLFFGLEYLQRHMGLAEIIIEFAWKMAIVFSLGRLCYVLLRHLTSVYSISTECVASTVGILSKQHIRIPTNKIVDYRVITPLLERILGLGSVYINTAGNEELKMSHISSSDIDMAVLRLDELLNREQGHPEKAPNKVTEDFRSAA